MAPKLLTSKRPKEVENHGGSTDRISRLPDSVLCHILSFLPTLTSVATTSLVSRRWRNLWQHLQVFYFNDESFSFVGSRGYENFSFFVNAVLAFRKSRDIRKFELHCDIVLSNYRCDCADMWIRAAINPNLEELTLSLVNYLSSWDVLLPHSLLNCTNLVSLSLVGQIKMNVQGFEVYFPSLKYLKLELDIVDSEFVLLSGCPILETLHLVNFESRNFTQDSVPPSSERLKFTDGSFSCTFFEVENWKYLGIIGNLQCMVEAYIDFYQSIISVFDDPVVNELQASYSGLDIQLRHSISKCSLRPRILNCPEFRNLVRLKFILPCFNTNLLVNVLDKCHMIQVLIIQNNKEEQPPLRTWDPKSTTVPKCLNSHLSYFRIEGYQGFEDEFTFAEYILQNGLVLEKVLIFVDISMGQTNKYCSLKRLTDIPRRSTRCQLKFDPVVSS